jgi:hypothetical protein
MKEMNCKQCKDKGADESAKHEGTESKKVEAGEPAEPGDPKKNWIAGAIGKPGALHTQMGVPSGEKIPTGKLDAAAKNKGLLGKRARLAIILSKFHH